MTNRILVGLATVFVAIIAWIWNVNYQKLLEIDTNLQEVKMQLAVMQSSAITEERVRAIVEHELLLHGIK